jgi:phosphomevalonate kinase
MGEYAVLDGGPAIVAAVDRGVQCDVSPSPHLIVETPGDDRFARAALTSVDAPTARYHFSDWNSPSTTTKAGLGGSAAATVCGCLAGSPHLQADALQKTAHQVHTTVQGSGSGIDVAAAVHGGILRFEDGRIERLAPTVTPVVVYSGTSASTGPRIAQYVQLADRADFVSRSRTLVEAFADDPLLATREACLLLDTLTARAGITWWTPGLRQIVGLAHACGGAAKPSGAGGGDCAVALFRSPDQAESFRRSCTAAGLIVIPTTIARGAHRL